MNSDVDIDACKQGEREALEHLYKAYSGRLMKVCLHYVADESAAEDILHDAFIIIFSSIKTLKDNAKLEGWMITIVRNMSLKYLQSIGKDTIPLSCLDAEIQEDAAEEQKNIELGQLLSAIESLPEGNREVFKLSVLDGLSHKEIGELLGINPHSSSSQLFRAKKMLRALLANYWMLLLLPLLIPVYLYFIMRDKTEGTVDVGPTAVDTRKGKTGRVQRAETARKTRQAEQSVPSGIGGDGGRRLATTTAPMEKLLPQVQQDSVEAGLRAVPFSADSLQKYLATDIGIGDSLHCLPRVPEIKMVAMNEETVFRPGHKKKYPWTFNFGYSSNAGASGAISNLDYLSLVDYANGGAAAKLHTWGDLKSYFVRNNALMDSVEWARMSLILMNHPMDDDSPLGEVVRHHRPKTFGLSVNKQLSPRWTFGTGLTYTRLKSEFESQYNKAALVKTQKIDYVGIPLRLTWQIWGKGRFNAYTTGGVTFEMPVHSSLDKKFTVTADSSFTLRGDIKARCQWSVNLGAGVQYKIFKPFSLYLEPNMFYYFGNGSGLETYRTEHPFFITVPFGLRLTW